jgi:hypothetical protein
MSVPAHPARRLITRRSIRQLPIVAITAIALAAAALPAVAAGQSARPGGGDARTKDLRADWGNYDARSGHREEGTGRQVGATARTPERGCAFTA